jgi:hypothetical protein
VTTHAGIPCRFCEARKAAEEQTEHHRQTIESLSDAALAALTEAIETIYHESRSPA